MRFTAFLPFVGFTPTPAQRVWSTVGIDHVPPSRLDGADREMATTLFGDATDVPPAAWRTLVGVFGRGSGKDELGALYGVWRMVTADVSMCGPGDLPTFIVIAPDMKLGAIALRRAVAAVRGTPALAGCLVNETADGFTLRRPQDDRLVALEVLAATRAGSAVRGRSILGALMSECAFFRDESSAVNDRDVYQAMKPRLMPGGAILLFSTPWAETGLFYELFQANHGKPSGALVAQAGTLVMRDNAPHLVEDIAAETARDPNYAEREFGARFVGVGGSLFFDPTAIDEAIDHEQAQPMRYPGPGTCGRSAGGDGGFNSDSSALVVCLNMRDRCIVALVDEMRPTKGNPLAPSVVYRQWISLMSPYQLGEVLLDGHYFENAKEAMAAAGIRAMLAPSGAQGKLECYLATKTLLNEGKLVLPNHPRLIAQLKSVQSRPTAGGGVRIEVPRRAGNGHGDLVSALVLAAHSIWRINVDAPARNRHAERSRQVFEQLETQTAFGGGAAPMTAEQHAEGLKWSQANVDRNERILRQQTFRPEEN